MQAFLTTQGGKRPGQTACGGCKYRFLLISHYMYGHMGIGHLNAVCVKGCFDLLQQIEVEIPVVGGGAPDPDRVVDSAVLVGPHSDKRLRFGQGLGVGPDHAKDQRLDPLRRRVVGG